MRVDEAALVGEKAFLMFQADVWTFITSISVTQKTTPTLEPLSNLNRSTKSVLLFYWYQSCAFEIFKDVFSVVCIKSINIYGKDQEEEKRREEIFRRTQNMA